MRSIKNKIQEISGEKRIFAKIVCILLATALWAFITSEKTGTVRFKVPIKERHLPAYAVISEMSKNSVIVSFEGRKDNIKNVNIKNINAYVDLRKPKIGKNDKYRIYIEKQQMPEGINISLSHKYINILVARKIEKRIFVIARKIGNVKKGFVMGRIRITPETVKISGAKNIVDNINFIYTEEFSIEGEDKSFEKVVSLSNEGRNNFTIHETNVRVNIPIIEYRQLNELKVPILIKNPKKGYIYKLSENSVVVYYKTMGDIYIKEAPINSSFFEASVDVTGINLENLTSENPKFIEEFINEEVNVLIVNKKGVNKDDILSYKPEKVTVTISVKK
jgi:YbbR domain-containing protein